MTQNLLFTGDYTIRLAQRDDLPAIVAIYNETIEGRMVTADTSPVTVEERETWFASYNEKRPIFTVQKGEHTVAWLSFKSFYGRPAYDGTVEVSIYITKAAHGQGLGKALLLFAEQHAPTIGIHTLLGFIFSHNLPSMKLFERLGYALWGQLPNVAMMDGKEFSLSILGKRLVESV
ncbi:N-acetyltransferase family protein [Pseudoalteromonas xiamenensis]